MKAELDPLQRLLESAFIRGDTREVGTRTERKKARSEFKQLGWRMIQDLEDPNYRDEFGTRGTLPLTYHAGGRTIEVRVAGYNGQALYESGIMEMHSTIGIYAEDQAINRSTPLLAIEEFVILGQGKEWQRRVYQRHYSGKPASLEQLQDGIATLRTMNVKLSLVKAFSGL